jgi:signal peptidase II
MQKAGFRRGVWRNILFVLSAALIVTADQLTKTWIRSYAGEQPIFEAGIFRILDVRNTGSSFGLFQGQNTILTVVAFIGVFLVLSCAILISLRYRAMDTWYSKLALGLILGGTVGNLIDRLARGYVTDFVDVGIWPTFNIADSSMVIGVILVACFVLFSKRVRESFSS